MARRARITGLQVDDRALQRLVNRSPELRAEMLRRLEKGVTYAKNIAPDETPIGEGYVGGLGWVILERQGKLRGYLYSRDRKTFWIEYGTQEGERHAATPAYHVLGRALDALR